MQTWVCLLTGFTLYFATITTAQDTLQNQPNSATETIQTVTTTTEHNSLSTQDDNNINKGGQQNSTITNTTTGVRSSLRPYRNEQLLAVLANRRRQIIENRFKNHIKTIVEIAKNGATNATRKNQTGDLLSHNLSTIPTDKNPTVNIHLKISDLTNENSSNTSGNDARNAPIIRNILFRRKMNYMNKKIELDDLDGEITEIGKNIDGLTDPEDSLQVEESIHDKMIYYDVKNVSKSMNNFDISEEMKTISLNNKNYTKESGKHNDTTRKTKENLKQTRNDTHFMSQSIYNHFRPPEEIPLEEMQPFLHFGDKIPTPKPENLNKTPNQAPKNLKEKVEKVSKEEILPKLELEIDENMDVSITKLTNFENKIPKTITPNAKTTIVQQYIKNRSYNVTKSLSEKNNTRSTEKVFPKIRENASRNRGFRNRTIFFLQKRNGMRQTINLNPNTSIANLRPPSSAEILENQERNVEKLDQIKNTTDESTIKPRTTKALPLTQERLEKTTTEITNIAENHKPIKETSELIGKDVTKVQKDHTVEPTTNVLSTDVVTSISISSSQSNKTIPHESEDAVIAKLNNFTYQSFQKPDTKTSNQTNLGNRFKVPGPKTIENDLHGPNSEVPASKSVGPNPQGPNPDGDRVDLDPRSPTLDLEGSHSHLRFDNQDQKDSKKNLGNPSKNLETLGQEDLVTKGKRLEARPDASSRPEVPLELDASARPKLPKLPKDPPSKKEPTHLVPKENSGVESRFSSKDSTAATSLSTPSVSKEVLGLPTPKGFTPVLRKASPSTQRTKQAPIFYLNKTDFIIHVPESETTTYGLGKAVESTATTSFPKTRSTTQRSTKNVGFFNLFNGTTGELPLASLFNVVDSRKEVDNFNGTKIVLGETIISRKNGTSFDNVHAAYILASLGFIPMLIIVVYVVRNFMKRKNKCFENFDTELQDDKANFITSVVRQSSMMSETSPPPIPQSKWEFPRSKLRLQTLLGQGNFGQVWKAEADDLKGHIGLTRLVAVKTIKNDASEKDKQDLLKELAIMQKMGSYPNVVTLLGCCTEKEPYLVIMEYVMYGKLLTYLRDHRTRRDYFNFSDDAATLTSRDLTVFAYCVARGMEYLSSIGTPRPEFDHL